MSLYIQLSISDSPEWNDCGKVSKEFDILSFEDYKEIPLNDECQRSSEERHPTSVISNDIIFDMEELLYKEELLDQQKQQQFQYLKEQENEGNFYILKELPVQEIKYVEQPDNCSSNEYTDNSGETERHSTYNQERVVKYSHPSIVSVPIADAVSNYNVHEIHKSLQSPSSDQQDDESAVQTLKEVLSGENADEFIRGLLKTPPRVTVESSAGNRPDSVHGHSDSEEECTSPFSPESFITIQSPNSMSVTPMDTEDEYNSSIESSVISPADYSLEPLSPEESITIECIEYEEMPKPKSRRPYNIQEKKLRKKEQNKRAALRYRQKKKDEENNMQSLIEEEREKQQALKAKYNSLLTEVNLMCKWMKELQQRKKK